MGWEDITTAETLTKVILVFGVTRLTQQKDGSCVIFVTVMIVFQASVWVS
jgi:hypothetical protein